MLGLAALIAVLLSYTPAHAADAQQQQLEAQVRRCVVGATTATPPGDVQLVEKMVACNRPLVEYLFSHGKTLGEAVDYASYVGARAQAEHFGVAPKAYTPDRYMIDGINQK
jgi:hypothetical protein